MGTPSATVFVDYKGTPHTFLKLDDGNGNVQYYGFAPQTPGSPKGAGTIGVGLTTHAIGDPNNSKAGYIDDAMWSKSVTLTTLQHTAMVGKAEQWRASPPDYNLFGTNCTTFVKDVLTAGNASYPGISSGPNPFNLIPLVDQAPLFVTDANGVRNFSSVVRDPLHTPGTPAYDAAQNPAKYGLTVAPTGTPSPPSKDPLSYDLHQNSNGTWSQKIKYANGSIETIDTANGIQDPVCRREDYTTLPNGLPVVEKYTFRTSFDSELANKELISMAGNGLTTKVNTVYAIGSGVGAQYTQWASPASITDVTTTAQLGNGTWTVDAWHYILGNPMSHDLGSLRADGSMQSITAFDIWGNAMTATTFATNGSSVVYTYDPYGYQTWSTKITAYDENHAIDTITQYNRSGSVDAYDYDNRGNIPDWDWFATTYDSQGRADTAIYHYENNKQLWIDLDQDQGTAANKEYVSIYTYVDGSGKLDSQTTFKDDGGRKVIDWDNTGEGAAVANGLGVKQSESTYNASNALVWSNTTYYDGSRDEVNTDVGNLTTAYARLTKHFDTAGRLDQESYVFDPDANGASSKLTVKWSDTNGDGVWDKELKSLDFQGDGKTDMEVFNDIGNKNPAFASQTKYFDAQQRVYQENYVFDANANGIAAKLSTNWTDTNGDGLWDQEVQKFDADGNGVSDITTTSNTIGTVTLYDTNQDGLTDKRVYAQYDLDHQLVEKEDKDLKVTKTFDIPTLKAINSFLVKQKRNDLEGVVGNLTATALGVQLPQV